MTNLPTRGEHELFWAGEFGDEYVERNDVDPAVRVPLLATVLSRTTGVRSVLELGTNRGHNLEAIRRIDPTIERHGVELNEAAFAIASELPGVHMTKASIQEFTTERRFDLVFTAGVLIHVSPDDLPAVYRKMVSLSNRYVLCVEYFNPVPVEVTYRGHSGRLFKRDFAGEILDQAAAVGTPLRVVDHGFVWRRIDPAWDDATWFLLEREDAGGRSLTERRS